MAMRPLLAVLALAHAGSACPDGWTPGAGRCYKLTNTSHSVLGCVDLCGANASLACIRSADENAAMAALVNASGNAYAWIGRYLRSSSAEPAGGWNVCSSGEVANFTSWGPGQPSSIGYGEGCADLYIGTRGFVAGWYEVGCYSIVHDAFHCLCEHGVDTSPEYLTLFARQGSALHAAVGRLLGIVVALWLLPALVALGYRLSRRLVWRSFLTHARETLDDEHPLAIEMVASAPSPASAASPSAPTAGAALDAAEKAAKARHARVTFTAAQLGWMLLVVSFAPLLSWASDTELMLVIGDASYYLTAFPWAFAMLALTLRPIDAGAIQGVGIFLFCFVLGCGSLFAYQSTNTSFNNDNNPIAIGGWAVLTLLNFVCAALLWPVVMCDCCGCPSAMRMPPRRTLLRLWLVLRLLFCGVAIVNMASFFDPLYYGGRIAPTWNAGNWQTATLAQLTSYLLATLILTPANRGRFLRSIAAITSTRGSREHEAASVAALLSNRPAAATLAMASERFRGLPLSALTLADIMHNEPDPAMYVKTTPATLGSVHAFCSHSWSDPGDAKLDKLHAWAGGEEKLLWLDKACIDQLQIADSLACLPVFLAGCKQLFVLAGPTYASRLWCVMEL